MQKFNHEYLREVKKKMREREMITEHLFNMQSSVIDEIGWHEPTDEQISKLRLVYQLLEKLVKE